MLSTAFSTPLSEAPGHPPHIEFKVMFNLRLFLSHHAVCFLALISIVCLSFPAQGAPNPEAIDGVEYFSLNGFDARPASKASEGVVPEPATTQASRSMAASLPPYPPMTGNAKFRYYLRSTYGPASILSSAAASGIKQARDSVPEWGQGMEGYGKRLAAALGQKAISHTVRFGLGSLMHEDPRYFESGSSGIWHRTLYAAGQTFVAHKDSGGIRPGYTYFISMAAGLYASRQWRPARYRTAREYISAGAVSIAVYTGKNLFKEFLPDIRRIVRR